MADEATVSVANQLGNISRSVQSLEDVTIDLRNNVQQVSQVQEGMLDDLTELRVRVEQYIELDLRQKNVQLAETKIIKIRQELEREFGHYDEIRRRATGILQAVDQRLVTDDVIQSTVEGAMMNAPRYWLGPCLVMVAAWIREDHDLAADASQAALQLDPSKTSLLNALVMRRSEQITAASWIRHFFLNQDPRELDREFVLILDAIAAGAFGAASLQTATEVIETWQSSFRQQSGLDQVLFNNWEQQLVAFKSDADMNYTVLRAVTPIWDRLEHSLQMARAHNLIGDHFTTLFTEEILLPRDLEDRIDDLLDSLVRAFDDEELPLRREELHLQAMIDNHGDSDAAAAAAAQADQALDEIVDFPTMLANAAMHPDETGASRGTQRLATALSKDWIIGAHDQLTANIRNDVPLEVPLHIDGWFGVAKGDDEALLFTDLDAHFEKRTNEAVDEVGLTGAQKGAAVGGAIFLVAGLATLSVLLILLGLVGCAYAGWGYYRLDRLRDVVRHNWAERRNVALTTLREASAELVDFRIEWAKADERAEDARSSLAQIEPADFGFAANPRRP